MNPLLLITAITSILAAALKANPQIPQQIGQAVGDASAGLAAIFAALTSGGTTQPTLNPTTIIAALGGILTALRNDPNLPKDLLDQIQVLDNALQQALLADKLAQTTVDYTTLKPIALLT